MPGRASKTSHRSLMAEDDRGEKNTQSGKSESSVMETSNLRSEMSSGAALMKEFRATNSKLVKTATFSEHFCGVKSQSGAP